MVANGDSLSILGQTTSRIQVAGEEYTHDVLVADDVSQDCLLGADFLASHEFVIDLGSHMLHKGNSSMPLLQPHNPTSEVCRVFIGEPVVQAGEERLFFAMVDRLFHDFPTAGVLELEVGFEERHQLLLARVVAIPNKGLIPLRAANLSSEAVTLHRDTTVAKFYTLSEWNEIMTEGAEYYEIPPESNERSVNQVRVEQSATELLEINVTDMEEHQKKPLEDLVQEFSDVFSSDN